MGKRRPIFAHKGDARSHMQFDADEYCQNKGRKQRKRSQDLSSQKCFCRSCSAASRTVQPQNAVNCAGIRPARKPLRQSKKGNRTQQNTNVDPDQPCGKLFAHVPPSCLFLFIKCSIFSQKKQVILTGCLAFSFPFCYTILKRKRSFRK